ncbi:MFS transporter [Embleya sp. NPDC005971]|uniref:MFS transporter n=1 Tax=unclassified Embleya TaxID=2699296 RepID=UPI0033C28B4E
MPANPSDSEPGARPAAVRTAPPGGGRLDGASRARLSAVVAVVVLVTEVAPLQYTLVATATERIGHSFPTVGADLSWMIIIIGLVGGATTPILGKLADIHGKKLLLLGCTVLFLAGSVLCALTSSWALFLTGRALQATSFAITAIAASLLRDILPRRHVTVAVGVLATGIGVSALASPFLAGALSDTWGWRSMFWFLVVYTAALVPLLWAVVPESTVRVRQRLDLIGSVLLGAGAALILLYVSEGEDWGWSRPSAWAYLVAGLVLLAAFPAWERRTSHPIIDPALLRAPKVSIVLAIGLLANVMIGIQSYAIAYMAQTDADAVDGGVLAGLAADLGVPIDNIAPSVVFHGDIGYALGFGLTALAVHLMTWQTIPSMLAGPAAGAVAKRTGLRLPLLVSLVAMAASMLLYGFFHDSWQMLLPVGVLFGLAFGLYYGCDNNLVIEAVPEEQQGVAAGMLTLAESFGAALGTAVLTAILAAHPYRATMTTEGGAQTFDIPQVYTDSGWTTGFFVAGAVGSICVVLAVVMKSGRTPATGGQSGATAT